MHRVAINNQIQLARSLLAQTLHDANEQSTIELAVEHHEGKMAALRDPQKHIAAEPLRGYANNRCFPQWRIARAGDMVTAQAHLVAPIDDGVFTLGISGDRRILCPQPPHNRRIVSFVDPTRRLLRAHAPTAQVSAHRGQRYRNPVLWLDQCRHRRPDPQKERPLQLIGQQITGQLPNPLGLCRRQPVFAGPSTTPFRPHRPQTTRAIQHHPLANRTQAGANDRRRFRLTHTASDRLHHHPAQMHLRANVLFPRIQPVLLAINNTI